MKPYRPVMDGDVGYIAANLRAPDAKELAIYGLEPLPGLQVSCDASVSAYTLLEPDGTPMAIVGTTKDHMIWLLGTDAVPRHPIRFLRHSKEVLSHMFSGHRRLWNFVHAENTLHIKWLEWLGFTFGPEVTIHDHKFIGFHKNA